MHEGEPGRTALDTGFFTDLSDGSVCRLLAGLHDPRDGLQRAVVRPPPEQDLVAAEDDGRHPDEGDRGMADHIAEADDEVGSRHAVTLPGTRRRIIRGRIIALVDPMPLVARVDRRPLTTAADRCR